MAQPAQRSLSQKEADPDVESHSDIPPSPDESGPEVETETLGVKSGSEAKAKPQVQIMA